jgi:hypothetical protein
LTEPFLQLQFLTLDELTDVPDFSRAVSAGGATLNWNKWIRQTHRWLSVAFTLAVIVNGIAISQNKYTRGLGLVAVIPLGLQFFTGMYLFVLPYAAKWRSRRSSP